MMEPTRNNAIPYLNQLSAEEVARLTRNHLTVRDFARADIRDEAANRERRAALVNTLPRVQAETVELAAPPRPACEDAADATRFERRFVMACAVALVCLCVLAFAV